MSSRSVLLIIIFLAAFFLRIWNLSSPVFTSDETRIAYRGYTLSHFGKDELGRKWPIIFNSLNDYQLPLTSYLTSAGVLVFGKNDLGARLPFILIGSIIPILVYLIASKLSSRKLFPEVSSLILTLSPLMIFLSKTPNEIIINTFFILLIFYLFLKDQSLKRFVITVIVIIVAMLTSKEMWIVLPLFTFLSLRPEKKVSKSAVILTGLVLIFSVIMIISFLTIEQSKRSLIENNLNLFTDITINNGINRLRGQGIESGWPGLIDKFLFSKLHFLTTGFLHWISAMQPAILFGQLHDFIDDLPPMLNFFPRVMLVALIMGIILMVKNYKKTFLIILILTLPSFLIYPAFDLESIALIIPFISLIIAFGFLNLDKKVRIIIAFLALVEFLTTYTLYKPFTSDKLRPFWIPAITKEAYSKSLSINVFISDNLVEDIIPYIEWNNNVDSAQGYMDIPWPYKFRQVKIGNIELIGSDAVFDECINSSSYLFLSGRDLKKLEESRKVFTAKEYFDGLGNKTAGVVDRNICVK